METKAEAAARQREYRRKYPERAKACKRKSWLKKSPARRKITAGDRRCAFCQILLASPLAGARSQRYCKTCRQDPEVKRYLRNMYLRRYNHKKLGREVESLTLAEETI